jgi:hypothetical protein
MGYGNRANRGTPGIIMAGLTIKNNSACFRQVNFH